MIDRLVIVTQGDVPAGEDEDDAERLRHHLRGRRPSDQRNPHLRTAHRRQQRTARPAGIDLFRSIILPWLAFSGVIHLPSCCSAPLADLMSTPI